jgi:hypothetical protein
VGNPDTFVFAREFLQRRGRGESRRSICRDFMERGIKSPSGQKKWYSSSGKSIEENVLVYLKENLITKDFYEKFIKTIQEQYENYKAESLSGISVSKISQYHRLRCQPQGAKGAAGYGGRM